MSLHAGRKNIPVAGVPLTLASVRTPASWLLVTADINNKGWIFVGDHITRNDAPGPYEGAPLKAGEWFYFREAGGHTYIDLQYVYVDAELNTDAVTFLYSRL